MKASFKDILRLVLVVEQVSFTRWFQALQNGVQPPSRERQRENLLRDFGWTLEEFDQEFEKQINQQQQ